MQDEEQVLQEDDKSSVFESSVVSVLSEKHLQEEDVKSQILGN